MPDTVLGLDLGPTSIGWALLDLEEMVLIDAGVRIFPEGVDRESSGAEKSKNQERAQARQRRRQIRRTRNRLSKLRNELQKHGLFPSNLTEAGELMKMDPYLLRDQAIQEQVSLHELGRIFLHMAKRRGFLSNRKEAESAKAKEESETLENIKGLERTIDNKGFSTLGAYLHDLKQKYSHHSSNREDRVRRRHTSRLLMYREFEKIWERQKQYYPEILKDSLKYGSEGRIKYPAIPKNSEEQKDAMEQFGIHGLIFFQRSLWWPESSVGRCDLEPSQPRCPEAERVAQRFKILAQTAYIRVIDKHGEARFLTVEERKTIIEKLNKQLSLKLQSMLSKLPDIRRFYDEEAAKTDKLSGNITDYRLTKADKSTWEKLSNNLKARVVQLLISTKDDDRVLNDMVNEIGLTKDQAENFIEARPKMPQGRMSYSKKAIKRLLPFLEQGYHLRSGDLEQSAIHAAGYTHPDERTPVPVEYLGTPPDLPNPIVRAGLHEVRNLVNAVIREYGRPNAIHVELARDTKQSKKHREETQKKQRKNAKLRADARKAIEELRPGQSISKNDERRYILWKEQECFCIYCSQSIGCAQLFNDECDIDHILPRWRSLDDSYMNKVIVHRKCNLEKGSRTVNEWLEESDPDRFNQIKAKAKSLNLPSPKYNRIALGEINLEDFVQRQLNDTAYMSRQTANFLKSLGPEVKVRIANGKLTHTFRHHWGLNELLNSDDSKKKNRNDHRHHAIDAVVVALTDAKAFYNFAKTKGIGFEPKIPHIRQQLSERLQSMIVSHKPTRKIAGAYHEETFYGATEKAAPGEEQPKTRPWAKDWTESRTAFVRRLPIEAFNTKKVKNLEDIRDATIKDILLDYAGLKGVDTKDSKASLKGVFSLDDPPVMPSGVPIRRVRCLVKSETMEPVSQKRAYQNIQSGNNHHIAYFEKTKKGKKIWEAKVVSVLALVKHLKNRDTNGTGKLHAERPVLTLCKNDLFTFVDKNDEEQIGKVRKFDKKSARVDYCLHNDARPAKELTPENLFIFPNAMRDKNSSRIFITILGKRRTITEPWL